MPKPSLNLLSFVARGAAAATVALLIAGSTAWAQSPPFGSEDDMAYATKIWDAMKQQRLAGEGAMHTIPYKGVEPHGFVLETFFTEATIDGHTGRLIVKRNYGPKDVDVGTVQMDPAKHLAAVTVMFQREDGYDADTQNWFWVKFLPDGSLDKNPKGMSLAGKVAKGAGEGCIACHTAAPGDDFVYTSDAGAMMN